MACASKPSMNTTAAHSTATRIWNAPIFCSSISAGTFTCGASAEAVMAVPSVPCGNILAGNRTTNDVPAAMDWSRPTVVWIEVLFRGHRGADRAAHAGAAEPAIAHRVLGEILLMIILGEIERRRVADLGGDGSVTFRSQRLGVGGLRSFGSRALRRIERVDAGAILRADVVALAHALGRIVGLPKRLEQALVGDPARVEDHQHD